MNRMFAIIEREMRKFFRSPTLMIMSLMMPIMQLIIMGNAFGGKIVGAKVAVVDYDHGPESVRLREAFASIAANIKTFRTIDYNAVSYTHLDVYKRQNVGLRSPAGDAGRCGQGGRHPPCRDAQWQNHLRQGHQQGRGS